jgi:hypothetical protein
VASGETTKPEEPHSVASGETTKPEEPHSVASGGGPMEAMAALCLMPTHPTPAEATMDEGMEPYSPSQLTMCGEWLLPESPGGCLRSAWDSPSSPALTEDSSDLYLSDPTSDEATEESGATGGRRDSREDPPIDWASVGVPTIPTERVHPRMGRAVDPRLHRNRPVVMVNMVTARLTMPGGTAYEETTRMVPTGLVNQSTQTILISDDDESTDGYKFEDE